MLSFVREHFLVGQLLFTPGSTLRNEVQTTSNLHQMNQFFWKRTLSDLPYSHSLHSLWEFNQRATKVNSTALMGFFKRLATYYFNKTGLASLCYLIIMKFGRVYWHCSFQKPDKTLLLDTTSLTEVCFPR